MVLNTEQKKTVSTIFTNLGTVIFVSVVLGKYIKMNSISEIEFLTGLMATIGCFILSVYVIGGNNR